jgi:predicted protein tyrosine phosphatase
MPRICVCGIDEMPAVVERLRPQRLISLLPEQDQPPTPLEVRAEDHLRLLMDDVAEPSLRYTAPDRSHIERLLAFLRSSPPDGSIVIHCLAGVSRSPAAALVALALEAPGRELDAARLLREAAPFASPNRLLIQVADQVLRRNGALVAAREAMGDPDPSFDFSAFEVPRFF